MHWVIADIGGTHARFALTDVRAVAPLRVDEVWQVATASYGSVVDALAAYRATLDNGRPVAGVCLAVAGPVTDGRARLTNAGWEFDAVVLRDQLGVPVRLVNDFHAQAAALGALDQAALEPLGEAMPVAGALAPAGLRFVIGPGTGLGGAAWLPDAASGRVLPTEIGHSEAAASDALERELLGLLAQRYGRVTWEHLFSGPGLVNLHAAVATLWGADPEPLYALTSREVVAAAESEAQAMHALDVFVNWFGGMAGNLALGYLARGGLFIVGSIAEQLAPRLAAGGFRRRFEDGGPMTELLREIPTVRIRGVDNGLRGAAVLARQAASALG